MKQVWWITILSVLQIGTSKGKVNLTRFIYIQSFTKRLSYAGVMIA